ncbi:MAG TPA: uracil-DNA glycosylase [Candidatus Binataceae bacterium]|nr:uracil-DNA glycosylase [Candidatus Binataceae bacterium]
MASPENKLLLDSVRDYLDQIREEGMDGLPMTERPQNLAKDVPINSAPARTRKESTIDMLARVKPSPEMNSTASKYPGIENTADLGSLREFIGECTRCKLHRGRTNIVFGVGDPNADLMFIGEGPGADEDAKGEPFVGRAGQLLTDIIERGMGLKRSQVYICNVVKCRPPENRNPEPDEVLACEPFLFRQIEMVKPRVIVGLGAFAVQCVLRLKTPISKLRGNWHEVRGIKMMPTFHPAYLLRNPGDKRLVWSDIQEVMKTLGLPIAGRGNA